MQPHKCVGERQTKPRTFEPPRQAAVELLGWLQGMSNTLWLHTDAGIAYGDSDSSVRT
jgi:hypothetical protein